MDVLSSRSKQLEVSTYGKLPCYEDFLQIGRRDGREFVTWLSAGMKELHLRGRQMAEVPWFVQLQFDSKQIVSGCFRQSEDRRGRRFPFAAWTTFPKKLLSKLRSEGVIRQSSVWESLRSTTLELTGSSDQHDFETRASMAEVQWDPEESVAHFEATEITLRDLFSDGEQNESWQAALGRLVCDLRYATTTVQNLKIDAELLPAIAIPLRPLLPTVEQVAFWLKFLEKNAMLHSKSPTYSLAIPQKAPGHAWLFPRVPVAADLALLDQAPTRCLSFDPEGEDSRSSEELAWVTKNLSKTLSDESTLETLAETQLTLNP
ncbi:MAG: TagF domain-containing protein [Planctomycetota bacterium]